MAKRQEQFLRDIKKRAKKGAKFNPSGQHPGLKNIKKFNPTEQHPGLKNIKKLVMGLKNIEKLVTGN
jgi:hypothetical protein